MSRKDFECGRVQLTTHGNFLSLWVRQGFNGENSGELLSIGEADDIRRFLAEWVKDRLKEAKTEKAADPNQLGEKTESA